MPITAPDLPAVLTKSNWDKNKGVLAKMAGFTGMGTELAALEAHYKKVKWNDYDMQIKFPRGDDSWTLKSLEKAMEDMVADVKNGECGKLRLQAFKVRDLADKTAKEFKSNKLIPKSSTALCESISKAADQLGVASNPASMGGAIKATHKLVTQAFDTTAEMIEKNYATHLSKLETALLPVVRTPTYEAWLASGMMTLARNLNQQIGNVENLAKRGYDVGMKPADCVALFKDLNLYARKAVPFEENAPEPERKEHAKTLLGLLIRAKKLK